MTGEDTPTPRRNEWGEPITGPLQRGETFTTIPDPPPALCKRCLRVIEEPGNAYRSGRFVFCSWQCRKTWIMGVDHAEGRR